jgi:hypothetical protein
MNRGTCETTCNKIRRVDVNSSAHLQLATYTISLSGFRTMSMSMMVLENVHSLVGGQSAGTRHYKAVTVEAHGAGGRTRSVPTTSLRWIASLACERCAMPLASARGPSDALQEGLSGVEHAFVHLDYEFTHQSEHARSHDT